MKITKIEVQKNKKSRFNIYIDDEFAFGVDEDVLIKCNLYKGLELTQIEIDEILIEEYYSKAYNTAINYLSYRLRSKKELERHLKTKEFEDEIIFKVIDKCEELAYINDYEFAQAFVNDKININNYGPRKIQNELYLKGIDTKIINEVLNIEVETEYEMALKLAGKRIYSYRNDNYEAKYRKLKGYLARRGYSYSIINRVIKEVLND